MDARDFSEFAGILFRSHAITDSYGNLMQLPINAHAFSAFDFIEAEPLLPFGKSRFDYCRVADYAPGIPGVKGVASHHLNKVTCGRRLRCPTLLIIAI